MLTSPIQSLCSPLRSELLKHWSLGNCPIEPDYLRSDIAFFEDPLHQWIYSVQLLNHQDATGAVRKWWDDALDGFNLRSKNIKTIRHLQNNSAWCSSRARVSLIANLKYRSQHLSSCSQKFGVVISMPAKSCNSWPKAWLPGFTIRLPTPTGSQDIPSSA